MPDRLFLTTAEVAQLLDLTPAGFLAARDRLTADHGFPEPMPTSLRPLRWRRDRVEHWIANQGLPRAQRPAAPAGPNVYLLEQARRA